MKVKDSDQMREVLREFCKKHGSQKAAAQILGVKPQHVSDMKRGRRDMSENIARKLGYQKTVIYMVIQ